MSIESNNGLAFGLKPRKPETKEQRQAFENHPRRIQDRVHRPVADAIYRATFGDVKIKRVDEMGADLAVGMALDLLGVDFYVAFPNGTLLAGQEKYLSHSCAKYRTVTVSEHSWKHCAAQIYFCGYLTEGGESFNPWVLLDWAMVMIATAHKTIQWGLRSSNSRYPSFWHTSFDGIPDDCLIASSRT